MLEAAPVAVESDADRRPSPGPVVPSRYHVGLIVVLGAIFLIALAPRLDTDLWWHLLDGSYISSHHNVPTGDLFSFTFAGRPWTDHEWLSELLLYASYSVGGLWGTIVVFAAVICAAFGLVYARMAQLGTNRLLGLFVLCAAFVASSSTWGARPQMLTLLFLAAYALLTERFLRTRDRHLLWVLPILMLLWTNLHGGWVLGLVYLGISWIGELVNRWTKRDGALESADLKAFGLALVAALIATAFNPNGLRQVLYPLVWIFPSAYSNVLSEWVSVDFHQPVFMVFEGMILVLIASFFLARKQLNWTHLLLILAFTHLALSQSRNVAIWSIAISPLLAFYLQAAILSWRPAAQPDETESPSRARPLLSRGRERTLNLALLVLALLLYTVEAAHFVSAQALRRDERSSFPAAALSYMNRHTLPGRTYADYAWGGYVLWKGYPRYRDFIDGRANTLFDTRILSAYLDIYTAAPDWQQRLSAYRIDNVLVDPGSPIAQILALNAQWKRVFKDSTAVLYTRQ